MTFRVSADIGGTFADVVIADAAGRLFVGKALTTPERAFTGLAAAIEDAARALGLSRDAVLAGASLFTYGTTRATNAIIERKVGKAALLVTEVEIYGVVLTGDGGDELEMDPRATATRRCDLAARKSA